jgi:hypothetical protein
MSKVVGSLKAILGLDKSKYDAGLKDAQKQVNAFGAFAKRALGVLAGLFAVSKIFAWGKATVASYNAAAEAEQKLATIMKARMGLGKEAAADLIRQAAAYQKIGVVADDVQVAGLQQLATFANQKESLESLLPAMNNLLAQQKGYKATSEDAVTIARLMGKALNGQVEALTRAGIQISDSQKNALKTGNEFERAAALAGIINSKIGQMNQQLGQSDRGIIQKWVNTFDDLKEAIGERILPVLARFAQAGTSMVESILKQSNALIKEKTELNLLVGVITDELTLQKDRKRLIDELNGKYPEFLKNLNAEKVTNQELLTRLEDINKEYEKRISLAIKEELIAGKVKKLTRLYKDQYDAQIELEKLQKEQSDLIFSTQDKSSDAYKADLKFYKDLIKNRENLIRKRQEERAAIDEEIEGVMKLVDAERKALEVTGGGGGVATPFDAEAFKDELKVAKEEFAAYDKLIMAGYEDEAWAQYSHLQEMGGDWRTYLENQLALYKNNLEARKLLFQEYLEVETVRLPSFKGTKMAFTPPEPKIDIGGRKREFDIGTGGFKFSLVSVPKIEEMNKAISETNEKTKKFAEESNIYNGIIANAFSGMSN